MTNLHEELQAAHKMRESTVSTMEGEVSALKDCLKDVRCQLEEAKRSRPPRSRTYADAANKAGGATSNKARVGPTRSQNHTTIRKDKGTEAACTETDTGGSVP